MKQKLSLQLVSYSFFFIVFLVFFSTPQKSYAGLLPTATIQVGDPIDTPLLITTDASTLVTSVATGGLNIKEYVLDPLAYAVKTIALQSLTKSTVNWINSGFNGSPAFVQDLDKTLLSTGDTEATRFITQFTNSGSLKDVPWKDDIAQSVLSGYFRSTSKDGFALQNPYTLNKLSSDPKATINGDFSKGGLDGWMAIVLNPANSPLGLREVTKNALNSNVAAVKDQKTAEIARNNGFLSFRGKCPTPQATADAASDKANLPGATLADKQAAVAAITKVDQAQESANAAALQRAADAASAKSNLPGATLADKQAAYAAIAAAGQADRLATGGQGTTQETGLGSVFATVLSGLDPCAGKPILTPGSLIAQSANKFLVDAGVDQYVAADEIGEIVNALMGQLVGNILGGGGLSGISAPTGGGDGTSYIDRAADPSKATAASNSLSLSNSFLMTIANQEAQITQYKDSWTKISTAANGAKSALAGTSCSSVDSVLTQAGVSIASATSAISKLDAIKTKLTTAVAADPASQEKVVLDATTAYDALQASGTLPSVSDITYASAQSRETTADTTQGITPSLYTKLSTIAATKICSP